MFTAGLKAQYGPVLILGYCKDMVATSIQVGPALYINENAYIGELKTQHLHVVSDFI